MDEWEKRSEENLKQKDKEKQCDDTDKKLFWIPLQCPFKVKIFSEIFLLIRFPNTALRRTNYSRGISSGNIKENYTQKQKQRAKKKEGRQTKRYKKQFKMMKTKR